MDVLISASKSFRFRDKVLKLTQYLAMFLAHYGKACRWYRKSTIEAFRKWQKGVSTGRKAGKIGNFLLEMRKAYIELSKSNILLAIARTSMFIFFIYENLIYLTKIHLLRLDSRKLKIISNKFRAAAAFMFAYDQIRCIPSALRLGAVERRIKMRSLAMALTKLACDIVVAMEKSFFQELFNDGIGDGMQSVFAMCSSLFVLHEVWEGIAGAKHTR